jgi:DNA-binding NarL/FixJ family response regulator
MLDICFANFMQNDTAQPIRVVLADAHAATLAGVRGALMAGSFEIVAEAADAGMLVDAAIRERPDICVLDADLPGGAIAATAELARKLPQARVVLLAASRDDRTMLGAVRAGAAGYLLKEMDPNRLRFALHGVTQGEAALPRRLVARLMLEFRVSERGRHLDLGREVPVKFSAREWDVLLLMVDGASTRDMANELEISDVTVRRHVSRLLAKLEVQDRSAGVALIEAHRAR